MVRPPHHMVSPPHAVPVICSYVHVIFGRFDGTYIYTASTGYIDLVPVLTVEVESYNPIY